MSETAQNIPPGWYPDANAPGGQRWWDGAAWTEHTGQSPTQVYQPLAQPKAPEGTKTGTVWIWLIVVLPLLGLSSYVLVDWKEYIDTLMRTNVSATTNPYASLAIYTSPGYIVTQVLSWLMWGLAVVFAALDVRELKKRGVPKPFHWAYAFIPWSIVYVIGRSIVARRRTGSGVAPLWAGIAIQVVLLIAGIVLVVLMVTYMFSSVPNFS